MFTERESSTQRGDVAYKWFLWQSADARFARSFRCSFYNSNIRNMGDVAAMGALRADIGGPAAVWSRPRGARRCLFGPPDPEKTRTFLESETKRMSEENRARWNFDFAEGNPLDCGRFVWTPAGAENECDDATNGKQNMQTRITDFMRKRKLPTRSNPKEPTSSPEEEPRTKTRRRFST